MYVPQDWGRDTVLPPTSCETETSADKRARQPEVILKESSTVRIVFISGHYLDQKRLKQGLYRHPWDDISYVLPEHMTMWQPKEAEWVAFLEGQRRAWLYCARWLLRYRKSRTVRLKFYPRQPFRGLEVDSINNDKPKPIAITCCI